MLAKRNKWNVNGTTKYIPITPELQLLVNWYAKMKPNAKQLMQSIILPTSNNNKHNLLEMKLHFHRAGGVLSLCREDALHVKERHTAVKAGGKLWWRENRSYGAQVRTRRLVLGAQTFCGNPCSREHSRRAQQEHHDHLKYAGEDIQMLLSQKDKRTYAYTTDSESLSLFHTKQIKI